MLLQKTQNLFTNSGFLVLFATNTFVFQQDQPACGRRNISLAAPGKARLRQPQEEG